MLYTSRGTLRVFITLKNNYIESCRLFCFVIYRFGFTVGFLITGVHGSKGVGHKTLTDAIIYYICLTNSLTMKSRSSSSFFELILDALRANELIT